jgi:hypothetical protein
MNCASCRYWASDTATLGTDHRECLHPDRKIAPMAEPGDTWGDVTHVETAPDFGCILFDAR